ncbi:trichohyalin [Vombatus ursinus]|uniref:trichohyalin n=1 Tax=Vombatus ursinus TaxID=29139 RepID=UPI000FFCE787|nr:trichohyalin [Vombatus ursinus]
MNSQAWMEDSVGRSPPQWAQQRDAHWPHRLGWKEGRARSLQAAQPPAHSDMSFQAWATYPSLPPRDRRSGSFVQGLAKSPSFLGRLQGHPRARSMEMPWGHSKVSPSSRDSLKGPLRATSALLESENSSCLWHSHSPSLLDRSQSPGLLRGIHPTEASPASCSLFGKGSNQLIGRQASLPHLLDWTDSAVSCRALALQGWSRSEQDLQSSSLERVQQRAELVGRLQTAHWTLKEQAQEIQRREKALELSQLKCELLDVRQKMESSLVRLEWERRELKRSRRQEQQRDRELQDKILHLQAEVMKVKLCLDRMSHQPLFVEDPEEPRLRPESQEAELNAKLQTLVTNQDPIFQEKPGQELSFDANQTLEGQEEIPLEDLKASTPQVSQDMIFLQEELVIIKEVNEQLSSELGQSRQRLRTCLNQLYQLQTEKKICHSWLQALEAEQAQLMGENLALLSVLQGQGGGTELGTASWQNSEASGHPQFQKELATPQQEPEVKTSCPRTHKEEVQYWKARWHQVANELKSKEEELEMVQRQRRGWSCKVPWVQELFSGEKEDLAELKDPVGKENETSELEGTRLAKKYQHISSGEDSSSLTEKMECQRDLQSKMKILERENAQMALVIQRWKLDESPMLQIELDACKQQLELERSLSLALQHQLRGLQGGSAPQRAEPPLAWPGPGPCPSGTLKGTEAEPRWDMLQSKAEPHRPLQELQGSSSGSPQVPEPLQPFQRDARGGQEAGAPGPLSEAEILRQQLQKERTLGQEQAQRLRSLTSELQELKLRMPEEHEASQDSGQQGVEAAESQLRESRQENLRLELLVSSLRQKLEDKEQALRELLNPRAAEQGETEMTPSSLLKKLPLNSQPGFSQLVPEELKRGPRAGWGEVPQGHCSHCNAFLEKLDKVLQGWEVSSKPAEKPQALGQPQKVLEGPNRHTPKGGRAPRSDLRDIERVKHQHRLVTEQLQDLFGERRERTSKAEQPPREWPEGSLGDQGTKKSSVEQLN